MEINISLKMIYTLFILIIVAYAIFVPNVIKSTGSSAHSHDLFFPGVMQNQQSRSIKLVKGHIKEYPGLQGESITIPIAET